MGDAGVARCPLPLLLPALLPLGVRTAPTAQATQQPCDLVYCLATPPITTSYTHTLTQDIQAVDRDTHTHIQRQRGEPVDGDGAGVASYHNVKSLGEQSSSSRRLLFSPSMGRRRRRRVGRMNQHCAALSLSLSGL